MSIRLSVMPMIAIGYASNIRIPNPASTNPTPQKKMSLRYVYRSKSPQKSTS